MNGQKHLNQVWGGECLGQGGRGMVRREAGWAGTWMMRGSHGLSFTGRFCSRWAQTSAPDGENVGRKRATPLCPIHLLMLHTASGQWPLLLLQARASSAPDQLQVRTLLSPDCSQISGISWGRPAVFLPSLHSSVVNFSCGHSTALSPFYSQILD